MSDENGRTEHELAAIDAELKAAKAAEDAAAAGATDDEDDVESALSDREKREINKRKRANEQAEKLRLENAQLKAEKEERDREKLSEVELLKKDKAKAELEAQALRQEAIQARLESRGLRMGLADPDYVKLVDPALLGGGTPEEIDLALKDLIARKPGLKGAATAGDTPKAGNPSGSAVGRNAAEKGESLKSRFGF